jgi:hypothetical protein
MAQEEFFPGIVKREVYSNIGGNAITDLTGNPKYPDFPDEVTFEMQFEAPTNVAENYGMRMSGLVIPAETANYFFYIATDDNGELWLSTDESPANKKQIAIEPQWAGVREYVGSAGGRRGNCSADDPPICNNVSAAQRLEAGKRYYIEALMKEGLGGDNLAVGWSKEGDPYLNNGDDPIQGQFLGVIADDRPKILRDPADATAVVGGKAVFRVVISGTPTPSTLKWFRNNQEIPGATSPTYVTDTLTAADDGAKFKAVASNAKGSATSKEANLTVGAPEQTTFVLGFMKAELFLNIAGNSLDDLISNERYPFVPDEVRFPAIAEFPDGTPTAAPAGDVFNLYGARLSGYFLPWEDGDYTFFVVTDDNGGLWLSTDDNPANKHQIAQEPQWNGIRAWVSFDRRPGCDGGTCENRSDQYADTQWPTGNTINLQAGKKYYLEALLKEGLGGDNLAVLAVKTDKAGEVQNGQAPLNGGIIGTDVPNSRIPADASVAITQEPQDVSVGAGSKATFTVDATGTPAPVVFQWYRTAPGGAQRRAIPYATGKSYTTDFLKETDKGAKYEADAIVLGKVATSRQAVLDVTAAKPPVIAQVSGSDTFDQVTVTWNQPMDAATAGSSGNYQISGLQVTAATVVSTTSVRLTTSKQAEDTEYTLTATGVKSALGLTTEAPGNSKKFRSYRLIFGIDKISLYYGIPGNSVDDLLNSPKYPDSPDEIRYAQGAEGPTNLAETYAQRHQFFFIPDADADYVFFISTDDNGSLWLSTDDNPANKKLIAHEPQWGSVREWTGDAGGRRGGCANGQCDNRSDQFDSSEWPTPNQISLRKGQRYYAELIEKEGGGGDNAAVAVKKASDPDPANGSAPVGGNLIAWYLDPCQVAPVLTKGLADQTVAIGGSVTLSVELLCSDGATYQWQFNRQDIPGATGASYEVTDFNPAKAGQYRVVVANPYGAANSLATLDPAPTSLLNVFAIEGEDFNYDNGKTNPKKGTAGQDSDVMPYTGGAYNGLGAVRGVDYDSNDGNDSDVYRLGESPNKNMNDNLGGRFGRPRGSFEVTTNYKLGWADAADWGNYTRAIPGGTYEVWAALSFDGRDAGQLAGTLHLVTSDATQSNQTTEQLGVFNAPGSGGWGQNALVPMKDAPGGAIKRVTLGGTQTLRFQMGSGDYDYYLLVPTGGPPPTIKVGRVTGSGDIEITFTGNLYKADKVTGPYNLVQGATSPRRVTPTPGGESYWRAGP